MNLAYCFLVTGNDSLTYLTIMLEQKFRRWEQEFIEKGMLAGEAKGLANQKDTLLLMIAKKFGHIPSAWREIINCQTKPEIISNLTVSILTASSPEEYGELLNTLK